MLLLSFDVVSYLTFVKKNVNCNGFWRHIYCDLEFVLTLDKSLKFSWQGFSGEVCHCKLPRAKKEWLAQSHPEDFVPKAGLELLISSPVPYLPNLTVSVTILSQSCQWNIWMTLGKREEEMLLRKQSDKRGKSPQLHNVRERNLGKICLS